jgi:cystathionine beta-lyase
VSHVGTIAHTAALEHGDDWLDAVLVALAARADQLDAGIADRLPGVRWRRGPGTYLAWLDLREALPGEADPARLLLADARVALNSGLPFGAGGEGFVRLNFATTPEILDEALTRVATALATPRG